MKIRAEQKNSRQSPRKVRLVANQIKDLSLEQAFVQLSLMERRASLVLLKVLRQAVANATNNYQISVDDLVIDSIVVKTGPTYKRMRAVSRGRGHRILKRTCHVEVVLATKSETVAKKKVSTVKKTDSKKVEKKQDPKVSKKADAKEILKTKKFKQKVKPTIDKVKDETKISNQRGLQQAVTKVHRRKSGV